MATDMKILKRSEMDSAVCWNLDDLFANDEAWEQELGACQELPAKAASYQGKLGESAQSLYDFLVENEQIDRRVSQLYVYSFLKSDQDTADANYQAMKGRCFSFIVQLSSAGAYAGPELVATPEETLEKFYAEKPELEKYRRYLTKARLGKEHVLSPAEENLLAAAAQVSSDG